MTNSYLEYAEMILLFGVVFFFVNWIALAWDYYRLPHRPHSTKGHIGILSVIVMFAIYLSCTMGLGLLFSKLIYQLTPYPPPASLSWAQLVIFACMIWLFYLYSRTQDPILLKKMWKDRTLSPANSIASDMLMGFATWFVAFPLVVVVGQLADMLLLYFFNFQSYEQVAVRYLKMTLGSPQMLTIALFTILIVAPTIEELLFRGFLQNYLKRFFSIPVCICISSLCFALFHLAASQGIGNISLVASLFTFALYLGFIYERQASLFASIALHMTFNAMSTFRILFFE